MTHPNHLKSIISCISALIPSSTVPNSVSHIPSPCLLRIPVYSKVTFNVVMKDRLDCSLQVMEGLIEQLRNANRMREARGQSQKVTEKNPNLQSVYHKRIYSEVFRKDDPKLS